MNAISTYFKHHAFFQKPNNKGQTVYSHNVVLQFITYLCGLYIYMHIHVPKKQSILHSYYKVITCMKVFSDIGNVMYMYNYAY